MKNRLTIDDLIPSKRNEDHFQLVQDKKTGKPKLRKKGKVSPILYRHKYPMFFRLIGDNPSIPDPVEEFKFHPSRRWRIDLYWPEQKFALEIEGGTYMKSGGGHRSIVGYHGDMEKYNAISIQGLTLLRFTTKQMESCESYDFVRDWFKNNA